MLLWCQLTLSITHAANEKIPCTIDKHVRTGMICTGTRSCHKIYVQFIRVIEQGLRPPRTHSTTPLPLLFSALRPHKRHLSIIYCIALFCSLERHKVTLTVTWCHLWTSLPRQPHEALSNKQLIIRISAPHAHRSLPQGRLHIACTPNDAACQQPPYRSRCYVLSLDHSSLRAALIP